MINRVADSNVNDGSDNNDISDDDPNRCQISTLQIYEVVPMNPIDKQHNNNKNNNNLLQLPLIPEKLRETKE